MHELYAVWLSCKGVWGECSLKLKAIKATSNEATELYDFLTAAGVEAELGEDLAKDLIQRHVEAEAKLPLNKKGQFIKVHPQFPDKKELWRYKCFKTFTQSYKQSSGTEITATQTATIEEDDFQMLTCPSLNH
ncbi:Uncharacterized protein SCF082_LOCUS26609 [Durusdinium trenchii]|uniref:Uncharacterized protein n=1 Tax=Durusdinium trenchii TaxID=1381693 RepID=A0ABP0M8Y1_9DINO